MYTFLHKKKSTFYQTVFFLKICNMYPCDQYFWLKIKNTYTTKQTIIFFLN